MYNLVYQPETLGDYLAIYLHVELPVTRYQSVGGITAIYHQDTLIGINVYNPRSMFTDLTTGIIRRFSPAQFKTLQTILKPLEGQLTLPAFHSGFQVALVREKNDHPDADALFVCQLNLGQRSIQVVTNSRKVKVDDKVIVALPGAMLTDGQLVQEGMMMKMPSQGMLCSEKTLGINPETQVGVMILPAIAVIGKDAYDQ
jgi:tRNA-binding EMAP/Myf-like protein